MKNRIIALILLITIWTPMLLACSKPSSDDSQNVNTNEAQTNKILETDVMIEGVLNDSNLILESEGVALKVNPVSLPEDAKAIISKVKDAPALDELGDIELQVYEFKIEGYESFEGVLELSIPLALSADQQPGAAYLNEASGQWEPIPFRYDVASQSVIIFTDHLSKYGVFSVSEEGMRTARVEFLGLFGEGEDENFMAAVEEYAIGGVPAAQCIDIGSGAAGDALQLGSDFLGNLGQSAGYLAYGDDVLSTVGDHLGNLGLLVSIVQISTNIYNGKTHEAVVGSMKTAYTYVMGKVVSKLSNAVLSASMASVAIVDYAINKFATEALAGRASLYRDAYSLYYQKGNDGFISSADWYQKFYPYFTDPNMTEAQLRIEIDQLVTEHCDAFWTGSNKLGIDYYVSEAREKFKWTAAEAGLNDSVRQEISAERRSILFNDVLPGVFNQIALKINLDNERKLREEYQALSKYLNQSISFTVKDDKKLYAKHLVRFAPLNDKADVANWTGKFKEDGSLSTRFTLYSHMYSGAPNSIEIFEPDADIEKDEPIRVIEFKVTPPEVEIVLGEEIKGLKYTNGETSKILQFGLDAAFKQADTIEIDKEGNFTLEVEYATNSSGSGNERFTSEVRGFTMEGKIDPGTFTGSANFTASISFNKKEISPMEAMEGETKEYITTTVYDDNVVGTVSISGSAEKVTFSIQMQGTRVGYTKLQYHAIDNTGTEFWGDNPTVTDKSGEITSSGSYQFSVQ